jgi:UDP-N-acetylmuramoyl-tripeptide--D-alanyl-D-alanine ligase
METMIEKNETLFTMGEIGEILGSAVEGDAESKLTPLSGIEIDSRRVRPGFLFVAVKGEKLDGHDFLDSAFSNGAVSAVVSREDAAARDCGR